MESRTVVVVGGGLSGLASAKLLLDQGVDVVVLEASNRVGGRLYTIENRNVGYVDVGGAYVGPTQDRVFRMAKELGLNTYKVYNVGDTILYRKGHSKRFSSPVPPMGSITGFLELNNLYRTMDRYLEQVSLLEPWNSPRAQEWDKISAMEWYRKMLPTSSAALAEATFFSQINFAAEAHEMSLLWLLWYVKSAGGVLRIGSTEGGAQERKFVGGAQQLASRIANKPDMAERVLRNQAVMQIVQEESGVILHTVNGDQFKADYAILATAPIIQRRIDFRPPLPYLRQQLVARMPMGSVIKTMMYYDRPYWREQGLNGELFIEDDDLPIVGTMDDTKPDGSCPCLIGFINGDKAVKYGQLSLEARRDRIAACYARAFQIDNLLHPVHYVEKNWQIEEWTGGCYAGIMAPGALTKYGRALREPIGRLHFAGTETAGQWQGYMEGAIEAGERAAREVLCEMGRLTKDRVFQAEPPSKDVPAPELRRTSWKTICRLLKVY